MPTPQRAASRRELAQRLHAVAAAVGAPADAAARVVADCAAWYGDGLAEPPRVLGSL